MTTTFKTLKEILDLTGKLDDNEGNDTPRERFREFLRRNVYEISQIQEYVEECLRNSGDQYNRALQDLINHLGRFLGFNVAFGRYQGVKGKIGFDGHWRSPTDFHIVIEVKTTDVYTIKAATLVGYVDELISEKSISNWDNALGLYVVGRPDAELRQIENAIIGEKRTNQLRIISTTSMLTLAELMHKYQIAHEEILALLRPSGPKIDPIVDLIKRLVAESRSEKMTELEEESLAEEQSSEDGSIAPPTRIKLDNKGTIKEKALPAEREEQYTPSKRRSYASMELRGTKPTKVSILGRSFTVSTWREVLERTVDTIVDLKPEKFEQITQRFQTSITRDSRKLKKAHKLKNGFFIRVTYSSDSIWNLCYQMLETIGLPAEELAIEYAKLSPE